MKNQINKQVLCVLKKNNISKIELDYEIIKNQLPLELIHLYELCDSDCESKAIIDFINASPKLQEMLGYYNYCSNLSGAWEGLSNILAPTQTYFESPKEHSSIEQYNIYLKTRKESLRGIFKERELAYNINLAYKQCTIDKSIIAYSHREVGWTTKFKLNNTFQIEFRTNFGYGWRSYFYTKLKFRDIDIIPFSEWVIYINSEYETLIEYSQSHSLNHESWFEAMTYVSEAYNLSIDDENAFISKYLILECEKMAEGLEIMLGSNDLQFKSIKGTHPHGNFKGHQIVEVKGEKISGALKFIQSILAYEKIIVVRGFIERIEKCNRIIRPTLTSQLEIIFNEIKVLEQDLKVLEPEYLKMDKVNDDYLLKRKQMIKEITLEGEKINLIKFPTQFIEVYPEYAEFELVFEKIRSQYKLLKSKIEVLLQSQIKIKKYIINIDKYFEVTV